MVVAWAAVRGMVGLVLGAVMAVVELAWVVIALPLLAMPSTRPWSFRGAGRLAEADRVRVNRWLGGTAAPGLAGGRALAYVAMRGIVGGLSGGVLVLVGIWVAVSWRALSHGTGERAEMSWYDPITWAAFVVLVVFLAVQAADVEAIMEDLIALTQGTPRTGTPLPLAFIADLTALAAAISIATGGALKARRARRWAQHRATAAPWRTTLRLVPYLLPLPVLAFLPRILELITGGRGVTFVLLSHIWPTFLAAVGLTAATGIMVTTARIHALLRPQRRQPASAPLHSQAHASTTGT